MSEVGKIKVAIENPMDRILDNYEPSSLKSDTHASETKMNSMKIESFDVSSFNFNSQPSIHEDFKNLMNRDKAFQPSVEELQKYYALLNSEKTSLNQEEYLLYVKCYKYERRQELESYHELLKIVNEELENQKEIRQVGQKWMRSIETSTEDMDNYVKSLVIRYKNVASYHHLEENELLEKELKRYDLKIYDIENASVEELIALFKNKDEDIKKRYAEIDR